MERISLADLRELDWTDRFDLQRTLANQAGQTPVIKAGTIFSLMRCMRTTSLSFRGSWPPFVYD
jgi:hypothetical protein